MDNTTDSQITGTNAKEIVLSLLNALNKEDFVTARTYVAKDFKFKGVLGSRDGSDAYFNDMEKMKLKYDIKKVFVNNDDVCILYDFTSGGITTFGCAVYHLENDKVKELKVIFDPRPILEAQPKR